MRARHAPLDSMRQLASNGIGKDGSEKAAQEMQHNTM